MKKLQNFIEKLLFGSRAHGERVPTPTFKSCYPNPIVPEDEWAAMVKFGSRYGTRGSFYQRS